MVFSLYIPYIQCDFLDIISSIIKNDSENFKSMFDEVLKYKAFSTFEPFNVDKKLEGGHDWHQPYIGWTMLMAAADKGNKEIVQQLLKVGADKAVRNTQGQTASDIALVAGHRELAELLKPEGPTLATSGLKKVADLIQQGKLNQEEVEKALPQELYERLLKYLAK